MKSIWYFGGLLLRMSPELQQCWLYHSLMPIYAGGAELNVAGALARWNMPVTTIIYPDRWVIGLVKDNMAREFHWTEKVSLAFNALLASSMKQVRL